VAKPKKKDRPDFTVLRVGERKKGNVLDVALALTALARRKKAGRRFFATRKKKKKKGLDPDDPGEKRTNVLCSAAARKEEEKKKKKGRLITRSASSHAVCKSAGEKKLLAYSRKERKKGGRGRVSLQVAVSFKKWRKRQPDAWTVIIGRGKGEEKRGRIEITRQPIVRRLGTSQKKGKA